MNSIDRVKQLNIKIVKIKELNILLLCDEASSDESPYIHNSPIIIFTNTRQVHDFRSFIISFMCFE